jgi:hypothetical protein
MNYEKDAKALAKSSYTYYSIIALALLGIGYYLYQNPQRLSFPSFGGLDPFIVSFVLLTAISLSLLFYFSLSTTNSNTYYWLGSMVDIMTLVVIGFITIAILFNFVQFSRYFQRGWLGVFIEILFYIPCKLNQALLWLVGQFVNTPKSSYIVIAIETLLIIFMFYLKQVMKWFSIGQQVFTIYKEPVFLVERMPITSFSSLAKTTGIPKDTVPMNFGVSFWFYVNDNRQAMESEIPIFCYGGGVRDGPESDPDDVPSIGSPYQHMNVHPAITFIPTKNQTKKHMSENLWQSAGLTWNMGHLKIYFNKDESELVDVPIQRWNLMALNYTSQGVDVFLNGDLVSTHIFTELPVYHLGDSIEVGGNGMQGAIKDIRYSTLPFSSRTVTAIYNNNMFINNLLPTYIMK